MYKGFDLRLGKDFSIWLNKGLSLYEKDNNHVKKILSEFEYTDGKIDGNKLQANWFPIFQADVFISHSHNDKDDAIALAGWLKDKFNITSFIDSCIWGHANELLRIIDKKYCFNEDRNMYDYNKRNHSTSHVYMMLTTALSQMIDETECLFFLNTPSSIVPSENIEKTESPWIYSEIAMTRVIRTTKSINEQRKLQTKFLSEGGPVSIDYTIDLSHLIKLNKRILDNWAVQKYSNSNNALDALYKLTSESIYKL
jgi:hypothetical protein